MQAKVHAHLYTHNAYAILLMLKPSNREPCICRRLCPMCAVCAGRQDQAKLDDTYVCAVLSELIKFNCDVNISDPLTGTLSLRTHPRPCHPLSHHRSHITGGRQLVPLSAMCTLC